MSPYDVDDLSIPYGALAAAWSVGLAGVVILGSLDSVLAAGAVDLAWLLEWRVHPALLWAVASPLFFRLGMRHRLCGPGAATARGLHAGVFGGWMLLSNVIIRLPDAVLEGRTDLLPEALEAAVEHGAGAAVVYLLVVGCGHVHAARSVAGLSGPGTAAPDSAETEDTEPGGAELEGAEPAAVSARTRRLALEDGYRIHLVSLDEVRWLEADRDHVRVHLADGVVHRVRASMKEMEDRLADERFLRIHRSSIVNLDHLREVQPYFHGDHVAILDDGTELRIPRTRQEALERILDGRP